MGIYIYMSIAPDRIDPKEWKSAYQDAMLISKAGRLTEMVKKEVEGVEYYCNSLSLSKPDTKFGGNFWHTTGDMLTGSCIESYSLNDDLSYYTYKNSEPSEGDVLAGNLYDPEKLGMEVPKMFSVWENKTQGRSPHIWLLAIGCLICDRFPQAAILSGDITFGQCQRAVDLANKYLDNKIKLPVRCCYERLYERALRMAKENNLIALAIMDELYMGLRDQQYNSFIKQKFSKDLLYAFYLEKSKTISAHKVMKEWLESGLDFESICYMMVIDEKGPKIEPEKFIEEVIDAKLHLKEKETWDFTDSRRPDNAIPDDVEMQLARTFGMLFGAKNWNIDAYFPLKDIKEICRKLFGNQINVDDAFEIEIKLQETDEIKKFRNMLYSKEFLEERAHPQKAEEYFKEIEELHLWICPEEKIIPELDQAMLQYMKQIHEFGESRIKDFSPLSRIERLKYMSELCGYRILMPDDTWVKLIENIMNDKFMIRYLGLYSINVFYKQPYILVNLLATNYRLFKFYWNRYLTDINIDECKNPKK